VSGGKGGQQRQEHDDAERADEEGLALLALRQVAARQRDHHRVVAAQDDVDDDDLRQRESEIRHVREAHRVPSLVSSGGKPRDGRLRGSVGRLSPSFREPYTKLTVCFDRRAPTRVMLRA
jgi:hypothetical protein